MPCHRNSRTRNRKGVSPPVLQAPSPGPRNSHPTAPGPPGGPEGPPPLEPGHGRAEQQNRGINPSGATFGRAEAAGPGRS